MCWFTVVVYRRGLMETWKRGIELIMDVSKAAGLPESEFEVNPPFLNLIIRFKESLGGLNGTFNNALRILPPCFSKTSSQGGVGEGSTFNLVVWAELQLINLDLYLLDHPHAHAGLLDVSCRLLYRI